MIINEINSPGDLKELNLKEMQTLAAEMREAIVKKVNSIKTIKL